MSLDFPAFGYALWSLYDQTGIRPEYWLPLGELESGYNPGIVNSIGCTGIFQLCPLPNRPVPPGFASLSASQQMTQYGIAMYRNAVAAYGPIGSATRAYQANLLPSTLATARTLDSVIAQKGSSQRIPNSGLTQAQVYASNPGLDANHNGVITVGDLGVEMGKMLQRSVVQQAIAQTYALRPGWSPVANPVYGTDFAPPGSLSSYAGPIALALVGIAAIGGIAAYEGGLFDRYR